MPGLVKIGRTAFSVEQRAKDLFTTALPAPFDILMYIYSEDCVAAERGMHRRFSSSRVRPDREFFSLDREAATSAYRELWRSQIRSMIERDPEMALDVLVEAIASFSKEISHEKRVELLHVFTHALGFGVQVCASDGSPDPNGTYYKFL